MVRLASLLRLVFGVELGQWLFLWLFLELLLWLWLRVGYLGYVIGMCDLMEQRNSAQGVLRFQSSLMVMTAASADTGG